MVSVDFKKGDIVKILAGPFTGQKGKIMIVAGPPKNKLALKVRDCSVLIEVLVDQAEKINDIN